MKKTQPISTPDSPITAPRSQLTDHSSQFTVHRSLITDNCSPQCDSRGGAMPKMIQKQ